MGSSLTHKRGADVEQTFATVDLEGQSFGDRIMD